MVVRAMLRGCKAQTERVRAIDPDRKAERRTKSHEDQSIHWGQPNANSGGRGENSRIAC